MEAIDGNSKFFLLEIPNQDCLMFSFLKNEIALTGNSSKAFESVFSKHKEGEIVIFVTIQNSEQLQGVCKIKSPVMLVESTADEWKHREEWKKYWQGKFKAAIEVVWLIPNCPMPVAKVNQFLQPVLAKKKQDFIVELALSATES